MPVAPPQSQATKPPLSRASWLRFWAWSLAVLLSLCSLVTLLNRGYIFDSSLMALLPTHQQSPAQALAQQRQVEIADQHLLFLISATDSHVSLAAAEQFSAALEQSGLFAQVQGALSEQLSNDMQGFYQPWRYQLLTASSRERLQRGDDRLVSESLARLYSPLAAVVAPQLVDDPLQLFFQWQTARMPASTFSLDQGWLSRQVDKRYYRLVSATLNASAYDLAYQRAVLQLLTEAEQALPESSLLLRSGLLFHAAHGAEQARSEISTIGLGSLLGIVLLLVACFRSVRFLLFAFMPIAVGCCVAMSVSMLLFERLHLITLAFGAGLVGVAIDYSLHYLCAELEPGSASAEPSRSALRRVLPSLSLGLLSSGLAYAAQGMAPFPGLQQMALFSVLGLLSAWLTVVCWLPVLPVANQARVNPRLITLLGRWLVNWPRLNNKLFRGLLTAITLLLLALVSQLESSDDLRLLQTSPARLLQQDQQVQQLLAGANPGQYFVVNADSEQALLAREEAFSKQLAVLVAADGLSAFSASSQFVPSALRQRSDHQLIGQHIYSDDGLLATWAKQSGLSAVAVSAQAAFDQQSLQLLTVNDWLNSPFNRAATQLWLGQHGAEFYSVISLSGIRSPAVIEQLQQLASNSEGVEFVNRMASISALLTHYRSELLHWLLLAYGLVLLLMMLRYGRNAWRLVAAPVLASLLTLAVLQIGSVPLTIFHGLALLLVLGLGLDASIFLHDSASSPYAWLAITLSSLTSLLAFGLLALSSTPVLHFFGETVLWGIIAVWLLTPCFVARASLAAQPDHKHN